jgi:carbonic anhydrase/acetyltransferase-like protein (isoleucine patch superfamily)
MAIVHAATLHDRAFVAMSATVLDGAVIEEGGVLAAGALLTPGKRIGRFELWQGSPARFVRVLDAAERARKFEPTAPHYVENAARFRRGLGA